MSNQRTPVISLFFWGVAIAISLTFIFQNLQPLITLYFLGKSTIPIPLSLAILGAFAIGGIGAFFINLLSFWLSPRNKFADRSQSEFEDEFDDEFDEPEEYTKSSPPPKQKNSKPSPPPDDTVRYGPNYEDDDFDDDDDVIDIKYVDR
jgi:uncharacterized integral membrane protein